MSKFAILGILPIVIGFILLLCGYDGFTGTIDERPKGIELMIIGVAAVIVGIAIFYL